MVYLYIASTRAYSGKSLIALGLGLLLKERGLRVGYVKPFGRIPMQMGNHIVDADAEFMRKALDIDEPAEIVSPFTATPKSRDDALLGRPADMFAAVSAAFDAISGKDVVIVGGAADFFEGSLFGLNALRIIDHLSAKTLLIEPWSADTSIDAIIGSRDLLKERFLGCVINKLPQTAHDFVNAAVRPYLQGQGAPVFAALHKDILLDSISVRQLNDILGGRILCGEDHLDEFIENYSIGAMDVDSALKYFRRTQKKAVITGAHRADIQLAALETSTQCLVLTGGLGPDEMIMEKARLSGVPILSVQDDTFVTVDKIEAVLGKIRIREQKKVAKTKEIVGQELDLDGLLSQLGMDRA